jgi:hypothetical protein
VSAKTAAALTPLIAEHLDAQAEQGQVGGLPLSASVVQLPGCELLRGLHLSVWPNASCCPRPWVWWAQELKSQLRFLQEITQSSLSTNTDRCAPCATSGCRLRTSWCTTIGVREEAIFLFSLFSIVQCCLFFACRWACRA